MKSRAIKLPGDYAINLGPHENLRATLTARSNAPHGGWPRYDVILHSDNPEAHAFLARRGDTITPGMVQGPWEAFEAREARRDLIVSAFKGLPCSRVADLTGDSIDDLGTFAERTLRRWPDTHGLYMTMDDLEHIARRITETAALAQQNLMVGAHNFDLPDMEYERPGTMLDIDEIRKAIDRA